MVFSGFSHLSRNFLANFREGARKRLNLAENWGGLGTIRDDLGSCPKVLKSDCLNRLGGSNRLRRQGRISSPAFFFAYCVSVFDFILDY